MSPLTHSPEYNNHPLPIVKESPVRDPSPIRYSSNSRIIYDQKNHSNVRIIKHETHTEHE